MTRSNRGKEARFKNGVSLAALALWGLAGTAHAQSGQADAAQADNSEENVDSIVVVGVRRALATAQEIKKNADTFVDSITATDIGAFPDKSAAEALQRVPGITVNRLQSADDSTHPSGEPTDVLIRGLPFVRTEFNGRDALTADSARGLRFNDVSPELLARVDSFKNQTADMVEGGIAGTVDLHTRLPLDEKDFVIVGGARGNYGPNSGEVTPEYSGLISKKWATEVGEFGLLANYAHSHVITQTESVIMDKIDTYCTSGFGSQSEGNVNPDGSVNCDANPFGGTGFALAPDGIRYSEVDYDRQREGISAAGQYKNNAGNVLLTVQYTRSKYENAWLERASHAILDGNYFGTSAFFPRTSSILGPADGTPALAFGPDGMLQSGVLTQGHGSWAGSFSSVQDAINTGSAVPGVPFVNYCVGDGSVCDTLRDGLYFQNEARNFAHEEKTSDFSANLKWDVTDRLHAQFDVQHIDASTYNNDILVASGSMANYDYSVDEAGRPHVKLLPGSNVNYAEGGLSNPHNYWIPFIQGHVEDNDADELALRADLEYEFADGGWLDSLKVGVRRADRDQTVRYSTFNWTPIAASWNCNGPGFNADNTSPGAYPACAAGHPDFLGYGAGIWETSDLGGDFFDGKVYDNGELVYLSRDVLQDFNRLTDSLSGATTNSPILPGYTAICDRAEATVDDCFTPSEVMQLEELTKAAYLRIDFGGEDMTIFNGAISVVGNMGFRVVETTITSIGAVAFPTATNLNLLPDCATPLGPNSVVNPSCYLTPDIIAFANGGGLPDTFKNSTTNWLPSFNLRLGLGNESYIRFAYSRAISRPDIGLLRNYVAINSPVINTSPDSPYVVYNSPDAEHIAANVVGYNFVFRAESGYAALEPVKADQFDLSFEKYFGANTSLTVGLFYKSLSNTIAYGEFTREFTNDGSTQTVQLRGPGNQEDGGTLKGVEVAFQTFFDMLPDPFDGLGMQANYTYVAQSDINNSNLFTATSGGGVGAFGAGNQVAGDDGLVVIDSHKLQGISDHTFNVVGLYEKGPIGMRLAYNWRSAYLTQNLDCCIGLPVFQKAAGFLDASIRYSVLENVELSFDASNLLNTEIVHQQQIFGDSPATPNANPVYVDSNWSLTGRRYQFGVRVKF